MSSKPEGENGVSRDEGAAGSGTKDSNAQKHSPDEEGARAPSEGASKQGGSADPGSPPQEPAARFDEEGLPLHRAPTLDDVRGDAGSGRTIAVGCFVLVALAILLFWIVRGGLLG